ncbi:hypothetical protein [Asanoa siamensis]|uniref:FtsX extracellular domain-containing protein n=1 Tax=Asanoa siamensis TaxID=926357 RepID=A0ABQ4CKX6_9ACTN|nr:hypothetical protein [Asanoa siamensis]GIF71944.1 hypothetical protein Asi02nite_14620 [Asanoa siamensis]
MSASPVATPEWQMTPRARKAFIGLIVGAVVVILLGSAWMTYDVRVGQDPGLRACGSFARTSAVELSEAEFRKLSAMFARSTRPALREHGGRALSASVVSQGPTLVAVLRPAEGEAAALRAACVAEGALPG